MSFLKKLFKSKEPSNENVAKKLNQEEDEEEQQKQQ